MVRELYYGWDLINIMCLATPWNLNYINKQLMVDRDSLKSTSDFFQLPTKIFKKDHRQRDSEYWKEIKDGGKQIEENEDNYK